VKHETRWLCAERNECLRNEMLQAWWVHITFKPRWRQESQLGAFQTMNTKPFERKPPAIHSYAKEPLHLSKFRNCNRPSNDEYLRNVPINDRVSLRRNGVPWGNFTAGKFSCQDPQLNFLLNSQYVKGP
jgi:hypothetical protein